MTCQNCGAAVSAEDKFCPICGVSTTEEYNVEKRVPHFCTKCGGELDRKDKFCPHCGNAVEQYDDEPPVYYNLSSPVIRIIHTEPVSKAEKIRQLIALTVILILAAAFLGGYAFHLWRF